MNRRTFVVTAGAAALAPSLSAAQTNAERSIAATRVFGQLQNYYALQPSARSHFRPVYLLGGAGGSATTAYLASRGQRRELHVDARGRVLDPPTPQELSDAQVIVPTSAGRMSMGLSLEPVLSLAPTIAATEPALCVRQANDAIGRFAGLLGFVIPRIGGVGFKDVSGAAVWPDGRRRALPVERDAASFRIGDDFAGASRLEFSSTPTAAAFV